MSNKLIVFGLFIFISGIVGERENVTVVKEIDNQGRSGRDLIYRGLIVCAFRYDADCFMNVAQNFLDLKRTQLLAQADQEVARASGSSSVQAKPSQVAQTIEKLFSDLAGLFRDGFSSLFSSKDDDDDLSSEKSNDAEKDDDDDEDDDDKKEGNSSRDVGAYSSEVRGKKKKDHPLKRLIRKILIGVVIISVLNFILKFYFAKLAFLKWLVSVLYWKLHALKLYLWYKNNKYSHHEIEVEHEPYHAEHVPGLYGYGHDEHDQSHGYDYGEHIFETERKQQPYWGKEDHAHDLAYSKQKPGNSALSWLG